jgi:hypothetical protein
MNLKAVGDSVSKALFKQEDPVKRPVAAAPVRTVPAPDGAFPRPSQPVTSSKNAAYSTLLEKTNFDTTNAGAALMKYLEPLKALPIDEHAKYKAAAAQAAATAGVTVVGILATFDGLKRTLQEETRQFDAEASNTANEQVGDKRARRNEISTEIAALQREDEQLRKDIDVAQARIDTARKQFQDAVELRGQELDGQKAALTRLLQG